MKMSQALYLELGTLLAPTFTRHADKIPSLRKDHNDRRIAWDILWASDKAKRDSWLEQAHPELNDAHITTGLLKIFYSHYKK